LYFNNDSNTGIYSSATDTVDVTAGGVRVVKLATAASGVNYATITPGATGTGPTLGAAGSDTDVSLRLSAQAAGSVVISSTNTPFVPAAVTGTPAQHALFRENVVKGWCTLDGTGTIAILESFNVSSIVDNGTGDYTVTWDRDFAAATYAVAGAVLANAGPSNGVVAVAAQVAGSVELYTADLGNTLADFDKVYVIAIGGQ
jgi:hypothetical protein